MSSVRLLKSGKFELQVRHPKLPKGRKFFTFDTEAEAKAYGDQWDLLAAAGAPLPTSLLAKPVTVGSLGHALRARANDSMTATSDQPIIALLIGEIGRTKFDAFTYAWCENWVQAMGLGSVAVVTERRAVAFMDCQHHRPAARASTTGPVLRLRLIHDSLQRRRDAVDDGLFGGQLGGLLCGGGLEHVCPHL